MLALILVHTEEEFDWSAPLDCAARTVRHAVHLPEIQAIVDEFGFCVDYLAGHPIIANDASCAVIASLATRHNVEIGCHMHPWVTPPIDPAYDPMVSYHAALPAALERAKLETITALITERLGIRPIAYLGGRYSFGASTAAVLQDLGYRIDYSINATGYYGADGGPDYSAVPPRLFWHSADRGLLRVPATGLYIGPLAGMGGAINRRLRSSLARALRIEGVLSRLRLFEALRLTPEGFSLDELKRLIDAAVKTRLPYLTISFHSPSVMLGGTPYSRSAELAAHFRYTFRGILGYLRETVDVVPVNSSRLLEAAESGLVPVGEAGR
jgi:hypothetical protein